MEEFFATPITPIPPVRRQKLADKLRTPLQRCVSTKREKEVSLEQLSKEVGKLKCTDLKRNDTEADEREKKGKEDSSPFFRKKCTIKEIIEKMVAKREVNAQSDVFLF